MSSTLLSICLPHVSAAPDSISSGGKPPYEMPDGLKQSVLRMCKLLSDPTRLRIVYYLTREAELNVTQICRRVVQSQPAVSHHLALMRTLGLVVSRRSGRQIFYSLRNDSVQESMTQLFRSCSP